MRVMRYEGVRVVCLNAGWFRKGAAVALPGIGIITGKSGYNDNGMLRHEFGHILQYRKNGFFFFWFRIAPASLRSAVKAGRDSKYSHMSCWTEWTANLLSFHYCQCPADWDYKHYPIHAGEGCLDRVPRNFIRKISFLLAK